MKLASVPAVMAVICALALGALDARIAVAQTITQIQTIAAFDPSARENPESIVIDRRGNIYVSLATKGEIRRIAPDGSQSVFATLPAGSGTLNGLTIDGRENIYAALGSNDAATHGVWRVAPDGLANLIAALPIEAGPNGITFDRRGNLYVADSRTGSIWRIDRRATEAQRWLQSELLTPLANSQFPIGANGVKFLRNELIVSNTDRNTFVRVPIQDDGSAGTPAVLIDGVRSDDFLFDWRGNLYAATGFTNEIVRVDRQGNREVLLTGADGIDSPSALAFGRTRD
jgi:sugar lactone lactonase YvrE